jgi:hypothetical protein
MSTRKQTLQHVRVFLSPFMVVLCDCLLSVHAEMFLKNCTLEIILPSSSKNAVY